MEENGKAAEKKAQEPVMKEVARELIKSGDSGAIRGGKNIRQDPERF